MRISSEQIDLLKERLNYLDADACLYLFGSRVDDNKKGGDIDLLIKSKKLGRAEIRKLRMAFFERFGDQKMDILVDDGKKTNAFIEKIQQDAIEL